MPIAADVRLGPGVVIPHPELVNLYGCSIGEGTSISPFVEIQRGGPPPGFYRQRRRDLMRSHHRRGCAHRRRRRGDARCRLRRAIVAAVRLPGRNRAGASQPVPNSAAERHHP